MITFRCTCGKEFKVRDEQFSHPGSAVIAAGENPLNKAYSTVVIAGLSAEATYFALHFLLNGSLVRELILEKDQ